MELLQNTNKRVMEIAFEVGYSSLEYFNKVFKDSIGMRPTDFREKITRLSSHDPPRRTARPPFRRGSKTANTR
ncbi:MAG: hypothetical protein A2487_04420 [Candidatus Raymondbacteria bacterium RifOxyC12_full_50_8]|uniref:HTH araC/xylS-type domain-containing protein n=1 Tax=Candidatus Raymondbacteria bacterium RIFOXYD12_FULL_49_13 TaxID=1817890 RepID=A0A1F7F076_UNCRA|nr:MAG: hypothetical protein A2350_10960 [Candidatus Raymondbacteria bacterium RifOxyB12_full_50_8]OGJ93383.1 MAG: hypothetical protein A2248_21580 [Candidatus Raymondbacteria bacterium RIFOXYA2_FULL_49_16]OGJ98484.1 MAG: hypothetical protein A2487_04420 [Candidatus Raymondbacteria bacterium RifOxyC12_full_50_8]OGK00031.1 MAG: hypothetical protein A2519_22135 [Candidatus Raymondbacteria bacterium RIFOXYD12_FULL_49_13]OGP45020.1 MAG: hypothetical protein A2324_13460 [Candidatus Raymondbacteria b